jgi:hypothetical protein
MTTNADIGGVGSGMGVPRSPDRFQRVYSPPEPPSTARRSTLVGVLMALVALSLSGFAIVVLGSDGDPRGAGGPSGTRSPSGLRTSDARPGPGPSSGPFTTLPPACETVRRSTVNRLVPRATVRRGANTTLTTCTFAAADGRPSLRVEARIFVPVDGTGPDAAAAADFAARWARARTDPVVRVVSLRRYPGLGDEAFRRFTIDRSRPEAVGDVVVRLRNAVLTVTYRGDARDGRGAGGGLRNEGEFLAAATDVAVEVIGAFK